MFSHIHINGKLNHEMYIEKEKENTAMRSDQEQETNRTRKKQKKLYETSERKKNEKHL